MGSGRDQGGPGDRPPCVRRNQPGAYQLQSRHQRRACRRPNGRADRLVADPRPVRIVARGRPTPSWRSTAHRHRRGAAPPPPWRWGTSWPRTITARFTPREPICWVAGPWRGRSRLRACSRHGPDGHRVRLPEVRWAELRTERTGAVEQVAGAGIHAAARPSPLTKRLTASSSPSMQRANSVEVQVTALRCLVP